MSGAVVQIPSVITKGLIIVSTVFPALSLLAIYLRWYARCKLKNGWRSDDWFIVVTWIITLGMSIDIWASTPKIGIDYLKSAPNIGNRHSATCVWSLTLLMQAALTTVKISVLLFYKRIFATPNFVKAAWVGIVLISAWGIVSMILHSFQGDPISSVWTGGGTFRLDPFKIGVAHGAISFALDILVLLSPVQKVLKLRITTRRKVCVILIFALGGFCCIAAAVRVSLVVQTIRIGANSKAAGFTAISRTAQTVIWCIIEPNCSIVAASLPCYGPFIRGRAPESLISSLKSILSFGSKGTNNSNRTQRHNGLKPFGADNGPESGIVISKNSGALNESETELNEFSRSGESMDNSVRGWEGSFGGRFVAQVDAIPNNADNTNGHEIEVTKTHTTTAHSMV